MASGSLDTSIKIWDPFTGKCEKSFEGHTHSILCLTELADGSLASGSVDKTIIIWD
jgi:WD40 repeat protein